MAHSASTGATDALWACAALGVAYLAFVDWDSCVLGFSWFGTHSLDMTWNSMAWLRFSVADIFGSAAVCARYRASAAFPKSCFETLFSCTMVQFGGTTLTGLVLGQPPSWLSSNAAWPSLVLMWWLTFYCPGDLWYRFLQRAPGASVFVSMGTWLSFAHSVTSWGMDKALQADHPKARESVLLALLTGILSATGGGVLCDCLGLLDCTWSMKRTPAVLRIGNLTLVKAGICSTAYWILRDPHLMIASLGIPSALVAMSEASCRAAVGLLAFEMNCLGQMGTVSSVLQSLHLDVALTVRPSSATSPDTRTSHEKVS